MVIQPKSGFQSKGAGFDKAGYYYGFLRQGLKVIQGKNNWASIRFKVCIFDFDTGEATCTRQPIFEFQGKTWYIMHCFLYQAFVYLLPCYLARPSCAFS